MQFENLKKKKDAAKASPIQLPAEPVRTPERDAYRNDTSFFSRVSRSLIYQLLHGRNLLFMIKLVSD